MIDIQIKGVNKVETALIKLEKKLIHPVIALKQIGETMVMSTQKNFEAEGRPQPWAPLSPSTIASRRNKNKENIKILQDTGNLRNSIVYELKYNDTAVAIGTPFLYGKIHQFGGVIKLNPRSSLRVMNRVTSGKNKGKFSGGTTKGHGFTYNKKTTIKIPQRQFLKIQEEDKSDIRAILIENLKNENDS